MTRKTLEESDYQRELGARMRRVRVDRGLTRVEAARRIGVGAEQLARYESGEVMPGAFILDRMARALDVSPGWLLSGPKSERKTGQV